MKVVVNDKVRLTINLAVQYMSKGTLCIPNDSRFDDAIGIVWRSHEFIIKYKNGNIDSFDMNKDHLDIDRWFPVWIINEEI